MIKLTTRASNVMVVPNDSQELIPSGGTDLTETVLATDDDDFGKIIKEFEGIMYTVSQKVSTELQTSTLTLWKSSDGGSTWESIRRLPSVTISNIHQLVGFSVTRTKSGGLMAYVAEFVKHKTAGNPMIRVWTINAVTGATINSPALPNLSTDGGCYAFIDIAVGSPVGTTSVATITAIKGGGRGAMEATSQGLHLAMTVKTGSISRVMYFSLITNSTGVITYPVKCEEILSNGGTQNFTPSTPSIYVDSNNVPTLSFGTKLYYGSAQGNGTQPNVQIWRRDDTLPIKRSTHLGLWSMNNVWSSVVAGGNSTNTSLLCPRNVNLRFVPKSQSSQGVDTLYLAFIYSKDGESLSTKRIGVTQSVDNGVTWSSLSDMEADKRFYWGYEYEVEGQLAFTVSGDGRQFLSWTHHYSYSSNGYRLYRYTSTRLKDESWSTIEVLPQLDIQESTDTSLNKGTILGSLPISPRVLVNQPLIQSSTKSDIVGLRYFGEAEVGTVSDVIEFPSSTTPPTIPVDIKSLIPGLAVRVVVRGKTNTVIHSENIPSSGIVQNTISIPVATWDALPYGSYRDPDNHRLAVATQLLSGNDVIGEKEDILCKVLPDDSKLPSVLTASSDLTTNTIPSVHSSLKSFITKTDPSASSSSLGAYSDMLRDIKTPVEASMSLTSSTATYQFRLSTLNVINTSYITVDTKQLGFAPESVVISLSSVSSGITYWQKEVIKESVGEDKYNCLISDGSQVYASHVPYKEGIMRFPVWSKGALVNVKFKGVK